MSVYDAGASHLSRLLTAGGRRRLSQRQVSPLTCNKTARAASVQTTVVEPRGCGFTLNFFMLFPANISAVLVIYHVINVDDYLNLTKHFCLDTGTFKAKNMNTSKFHLIMYKKLKSKEKKRERVFPFEP